MYKIFDIHSHVYPDAIASAACEKLSEFYNYPIMGKGTAEDMALCAKKAEVSGMLILGVATNARQVQKVNDAIADNANNLKAKGFLCYGLAGMYQDFDDKKAEIRRIKKLGLLGVKIHPDIQAVNIDDPSLLSMYEELEKENLLLYTHMGDFRPEYKYSTAQRLLEVRRLFPSLRIVAAHFGGYTATDDAIKYLTGLDNMWFDCSSSLWNLSPQKAESLIKNFGSDKVMWGTDYPMMTHESELERFFILNLTERERQDILWNNAMNLLKI